MVPASQGCAGPAALRRLYHYLVRQGFDGAAARAALEPHTMPRARDSGD